MSKILIIEDDLIFAGLFQTVLEAKLPKSGIIVEHSRTMEEAAAKAVGVEAIILDLTLSAVWNADTTPTKIPELRKFAPVIVVTGKKTDDDYLSSQWVSDLFTKWGADDFIPKDDPNVMMRIFYAINAAVGRKVYNTQNKLLTEQFGNPI